MNDLILRTLFASPINQTQDLKKVLAGRDVSGSVAWDPFAQVAIAMNSARDVLQISVNGAVKVIARGGYDSVPDLGSHLFWNGVSNFVAISSEAGGGIYTSTTGEVWTRVGTSPVNSISAAYGDFSYVIAPIAAGSVWRSTDLITWSQHSTSTGAGFNRIRWLANQFYAVGTSGTVSRSANGTSWETLRQTGSDILYDIAWSGTVWVAAGANSTNSSPYVISSSDLSTWTVRTSGAAAAIRTVFWAPTGVGSMFIASTPTNGGLFSSTNATTWSSVTNPAGAIGVTGLFAGSTFLFAVGREGLVMRTSSGSATSFSLSVPAAASVKDLSKPSSSGVLTIVGFHSNGGFIGEMSLPDARYSNVYTSASWINSVYEFTNGSPVTVAVGNGGLILRKTTGGYSARTSGTTAALTGVVCNPSGSIWVVSTLNEVLRSTDQGLTWSRVATPNLVSGVGLNYNSVTYDEAQNQFILVGDYSYILSSSDGIAWVVQEDSAYSFNAVATNRGAASAPGDGIAVAVGYRGKVRTITGTTTSKWKYATSQTPSNLFGVCWNGSIFTAVGENGEALTSSDGINWTARSTGTTNQLNSVVWASNQLVTVGAFGTIRTSPTGVTWTARTSGTTLSLNSVAWSGTQLVAVGATGTVITSTDGITWTARTSGTTNQLNHVTWSGSQFVAVGNGGVVLTSPTGTTWTVRTSGTTQHLTSIVWGAGGTNKFLAVGPKEFVLSSVDGVVWDIVTLQTPFNQTVNSIAVYGSDLISVGVLGEVRTSAEGGSTWVLRTLTYPYSYSTNFLKVNQNNGVVVAVGTSGSIATLVAGSNFWGIPNQETFNQLNDIVVTQDKAIAVGHVSSAIVAGRSANVNLREWGTLDLVGRGTGAPNYTAVEWSYDNNQFILDNSGPFFALGTSVGEVYIPKGYTNSILSFG